MKNTDPKVPRRRGIGGAHNKNEFLKNNVKILSVQKHPKLKGIEKVVYKVPSLDPKTGEITGWRAQEFKKTIYDPSVISDDDFLKFGKEAAADAASKGNLTRVWEGYDSNGVKWIGYTDTNGTVTSFFPDL
ncbi:CdiA family toxin C-terminal domain-containing protein [Bacillus sonorensis]|nr:CdiA family toxin C-terminal domain-containing protein [Bacillus sonorensis]